MNKEEIKHFKSLLKQGSLRHMNILLNDKFQSELLDIIKDYERLIKEKQQLKETLDETTLILKSCILELMDIAKLDYYWIVSNKIEKAKEKIISYKVMGNNDTKFFIDKGDSND